MSVKREPCKTKNAVYYPFAMELALFGIGVEYFALAGWQEG